MGEHLIKRPAQTSPQRVQSTAQPQERHDGSAAGRLSEGFHAYLGGAWISASPAIYDASRKKRLSIDE